MTLRTALCCWPLLAAVLPPLHAGDLPRAHALEESAVRALLGKKGIVTGKVTDAFESPKGMTFLNLEGGKFTLVAYKDCYDKFEGGSPAKLYKNQTIEVTGEVFEYRPKNASKDHPGKLEIKLSSPGQIKILTADAGAKPQEPKADPKTKTPDAKKTPKPVAPDAPTEKPARVDPKKYFK